MWVYRGTSLQQRLRLPRNLAFWVDYWLFLHSDDTHPLWCARPLGLALIAAAALDAVGRQDLSLRQQLANEAVAAARLGPYITILPPAPADSPLLETGQWRPDWIHWFNSVSAVESKALVIELANATAQAIHDRNYDVTAFLARRLASELADHEWTNTLLLFNVRAQFCDAGIFASVDFDVDTFRRVAAQAFTEYRARQFLVTVPITAVQLNAAVVKRYSNPDGFVSRRNDDGSVTVTGIQVNAAASQASEAAAIALERARKLLEKLRLSFYVQTRFVGDLDIVALDSDDRFTMPLPQPFWPRTAVRRRELPTLPPVYAEFTRRLPADERARWSASQWHLSQALSAWAEDGHAAASHAWQALESFVGGTSGTRDRVSTLIPAHVDYAVQSMGEHLATGVLQQKSEIRRLLPTCDWVVWTQHRAALSDWLAATTDPTSASNFGKWRRPAAPLVLFHRTSGLLPTIRRHVSGTRVRWLDARANSDVRLLYGLRNRVVHRGDRILSRRAATYLAQAALELLFSAMKTRIAQSKNVGHWSVFERHADGGSGTAG